MSTSKNLLARDILKTLLNVFSEGIKQMYYKSFDFSKTGIERKDIKNIFSKIDYKIKNAVSFETNIIYQYLLIRINEFLPKMFEFNSNYSALYFRRIINYLNLLNESSIDIVEDETVKIFFFLLFLFIDESYYENKKSNKSLDLDEAFFKGTFIELTKKYSSKVQYKESEDIRKTINSWEIKIRKDIILLIDFTFQRIKDLLKEYGNNSDKIIKDMNKEASDILFKLDETSNNNLSEELIEQIKNFYSKKDYLVFTNFFSENEGEELRNNIDSKFLNSIETQYFQTNFDYSSENDKYNIIDSKTKLNQYLNFKSKYYKRMFLSSLPEVFKWDLNDEVTILSLVDNDISSGNPIDFENVEKFKYRLKNIEQDNISKIVGEIFNDDLFYDYYFSILKSDIIKNFFTNNLYIDENGKEFKFIDNKLENSECFEEIYKDFLEKYDKKNENYKEFKNLIILKILSFGDRAYTITFLRKIVINPVQFFIGKNMNEEDIKIILKGYLLIILLHETEHFFRLLNKTKKVFENTPREREGGRLFIKYLFGVESINHINRDQAKEVLNYDNWKDHQNVKKIFIEQLEDIEDDNLNEFILNYFPNSISFYTTKNIRGKKGKIIQIKK